jgi:hypothetical protein
MYQKVPLITTKSQQFTITLYINGSNQSFKFIIMWNHIADYWVLTIINLINSAYIIDSVPLVTGQINTNSLNILRQFDYLEIGRAYLVPSVSVPKTDYPDNTNLDSEFELVWDDNA